MGVTSLGFTGRLSKPGPRSLSILGPPELQLWNFHIVSYEFLTLYDYFFFHSLITFFIIFQDAAATSWLTTPVIITLSVGAVVVVGAIIIFVVLKCKDK